MDDRRDRFRRQLALLEGAGDPAAAIDAGLYVARPMSSERMIRRIELEPRATRVVTGPIGSGKSTELIVISRALSQNDELWPVYIDVSRVHDLAELREGSLIAAAGVWLSEREHLDSKPLQQLRELAYGVKSFPNKIWAELKRTESTEHDTNGGILQPPNTTGALAWQIAGWLRDAILQVAPYCTPILLFDSLDRVRDTASFRTILEKDAAALVDHGFGVILTAPVDTVWLHADQLRTATKSWDTLPYEDPRKNPEAFAFLLELLRRRISDGLIGDSAAHRIVNTSGGVLRDLIELARNAVEEAYMGGRDSVSQADVAASIARLARSLSLGLDNVVMTTLRSVHETGKLDRFDEATLRLLKSRQIIEHYAEDSYFEVHPVLLPMIERWAAAS